MKQLIGYAFLLTIIVISKTAVAQVATGGNYSLDQTVVAAGGGQSSAGGNFTIDATIGEAIAGTRSTASPFTVTSGFWTANAAIAPTAAPVSISGRVTTPQEFGLTNALVTLTDAEGNAQTVVTGKFGSYRFTNVMPGETYILSVKSKRYTYAPQIVTPQEDLTGINFTAQ